MWRLFFAVTLILSPLAAAQENEEAEIHEFFQRVWSPYCKGNSLLECPSSKAERLRDELKLRYKNGEDLGELQALLKSRYGNQVRMEPQSSFRGNLAYTIPWIAFFLVSIFVAFYWRKRTRKLAPAQPKNTKSTNIDPEMQKKIEEELNDRLT